MSVIIENITIRIKERKLQQAQYRGLIFVNIAMEMQKRKDKVHLVDITSETETRDIIESDAQKLLVIQREGHFTFRCIDCLHNPKLLLQSMIFPCIVHGKNAEDLGEFVPLSNF